MLTLAGEETRGPCFSCCGRHHNKLTQQSDHMSTPPPVASREGLQCFKLKFVGLGGLGVACSPRDSRFAVSNPAEVDGFFQDVKILSTSPPGGILSWGSRV